MHTLELYKTYRFSELEESNRLSNLIEDDYRNDIICQLYNKFRDKLPLEVIAKSERDLLFAVITYKENKDDITRYIWDSIPNFNKYIETIENGRK